MPAPELRKTLSPVEEIHHDFGPPPAVPLRRTVGIAIIANPFAGRCQPDIAGFMEDLKPLGLTMARQIIGLPGGDPRVVQGFGKGVNVGAAQEREQDALRHGPGGYAMRAALGGALAIVPSARKVGGIGARLDMPVTHVNASYVRSHLDAVEVGVPDGPRAAGMTPVLVMTMGPRVHHRAGGLAAGDVLGKAGPR